MYTEFIIIYVLLAILAVLLIGVLVLQIILLKKSSGSNSATYRGAGNNIASAQTQEGGIAFCRRCATRFDATSRICPKCGTPRQ
ncbi:MAG: hypothetical protein IKU23_03385 [Clostridia bacterium]|nr:hypothetical protein [Clostridia bacterium]